MQVWLHIRGGGDNISVEVTLVNKTATRFAEAAFLTFDSVQSAASDMGSGWAMDKLGEWVSPLSVADGGSVSLHPVNTGILYAHGPSGGGRGIFFRTMDSAVVRFGAKVPFPTPVHGQPDVSQGKMSATRCVFSASPLTAIPLPGLIHLG